MASTDIIIGIVGSGGDGVITAGEFIVSAVSSEGLFSFMLKSYGAQIRGGESSCRVRISEQPVQSQGDEIDVLVTFSWADLLKFEHEVELREGTVILYDEDDPMPEDHVAQYAALKAVTYAIPFKRLAKERTQTILTKNVIMLGVLAELFGLPAKGIRHAIARKFAAKPGVVEKNIDAFGIGREWVKENLEKRDPFHLEYTPGAPKLVMEGNAATALGAVVAGCRFYAGYPITPAGEVMVWMARHLPALGGIMVQCEDEISAAGMVVGAAFGGAKAMCATSGPGLSLKSEMLGLASIAEVPIVIVDVQRGGPSTGIPTKTEQSDLMHAIYGSHGDSPRVVIAPTDVEDCFDTAVQAFDIAEEFQIPVILLSDQFIAQRKETVRPFDVSRRAVYERVKPGRAELVDYKRYRLDTKTGVSPMAVPGMPGGQYPASGIEHSEAGDPTSRVDTHSALTEKRYRKYRYIIEKYSFVRTYGDEDAEVGILGWGSSKGVIKETVLRLQAEGRKVHCMIPQLLHPFPKEAFDRFLAGKKILVVVELNYRGMFLQFIRSRCDIKQKVVHYGRTGGKPFSVREIYDVVREVL
ncbi:MAG: 2-oxoacid:acceptor oxidoreductase subunit alpha [Candidatus Krumholzibacteriota bacterium]|nr:2-oxoacid:acceptor oxidoreductase subunit alpha [Candidatus Krumholzibacteriota bacterium]